jgi:hypothetical protein
MDGAAGIDGGTLDVACTTGFESRPDGTVYSGRWSK